MDSVALRVDNGEKDRMHCGKEAFYMKRILGHLEPQSVFYYFEEIAGIPHGSGNAKQIADYCEQFAVSRGLQHSRDSHDNVIIVKPAAKGYETLSCTSVPVRGSRSTGRRQ